LADSAAVAAVVVVPEADGSFNNFWH